MAIKGSGPLSFADITAEFSDTPPHSLSEFYRDGGKVPSVNTNIPTSGTISFGNFYNAVNELLVQVTSTASVNAQTLFGSNWGTAIPKRLLIPSGIAIGPLTIPSGLVGDLIVQNDGEIQGLAGGPNGGAGGNAITASSSFTLENFGAVRGGGGGGGKGGTGGNGEASTPVTEGPYYDPFGINGTGGDYQWNENIYSGLDIVWSPDDQNLPYYFEDSAPIPSNGKYVIGDATFTRGARQDTDSDDFREYAISKTTTVIAPTTGGAGGDGGIGRGYGQALSAGNAGAAGGTNAGTGGTGGSGGDWGSNGATGATGAAGNISGGSAGSGGGAAGRAVLMNAGTLTVSATGTINGAY